MISEFTLGMHWVTGYGLRGSLGRRSTIQRGNFVANHFTSKAGKNEDFSSWNLEGKRRYKEMSVELKDKKVRLAAKVILSNSF